MKRLVISSYKYSIEQFEIVDKKRVPKTEEKEVDVRKELYDILRMPGMYANGVETCDGVDLAGKILSAEEDYVDVGEVQIVLLQKVFDKLIGKEHKPMAGQIALGGERYIELIQRVFKAEEV